MKKLLLSFLALNSFFAFSQEEDKIDYGKLFGSFESNIAWYLNNKDKSQEPPDYGRHPNDPLRNNTYLQLNYSYKNFTAGIQGESYNLALLSYNPKYEHTNIGTWYLNYKSDKIDITAGYFYEQFGSGLIFRTWEDRSLGINNSIRGGRVVYSPLDYLSFTGLYGKQRTGFDVANSEIYGFNTEFDLFEMLENEKMDLSFGLSYVGRNEVTTVENPNFEDLTNAYSGRFNFLYNSFYISSEYIYKSEDAIIINDQIDNNFIKPGNAVLVNFGYSVKGLGINATLRRLENMTFYSQREPDLYTREETSNGPLTSYGYSDMLMNYVPSLTKQQHYTLANIYVYQAQPKVEFPDPSLQKAGETGGQVDLFYNFKKGTSLGGKTGTTVFFNFCSWYNLDGEYIYYQPISAEDPTLYSDYNTTFFGSSQKYYSDYNLELNKKINDKLSGNFTYINQYYNGEAIGGGKLVKTNIIATDFTYLLNESRSFKIQAEHMWADADMHNWVSGGVEFFYNPRISFYITDAYNYGNLIESDQTHYFNIGGSYTKGALRVALNYGKQRGGLVCVGGVCRYVPENVGVGINLNYTF